LKRSLPQARCWSRSFCKLCHWSISFAKMAGVDGLAKTVLRATTPWNLNFTDVSGKWVFAGPLQVMKPS
jgi:hypothetical protein